MGREIPVTNNNKIKSIGILTSPLAQANIRPFLNLVKIVQSFSDNSVILLTYDCKNDLSCLDNINTIKIEHKSGKKSIQRFFSLLMTQILMSRAFINHSRKVPVWIFFIADTLILPIITAKLLRKKVFLTVGGYLDLEVKFANRRSGLLLRILKQINFYFADGIIIYSSNLIKAWHLEKYRKKIFIAHRHFIDFEKFGVRQEYQNRSNVIGYIGRFNVEKGVLNFIQAIPLILEMYPEYHFLIAGEGPQSQVFHQFISERGLQNRIQITGWIDHDKLPEILNGMKLFVLPSFSEGLPNIMLESMACGTPVIATAVGAIPDFIEDGKTGFILRNNSAECIKDCIVKAIESGSLDNISVNSRNIVKSHFTFEKELETFTQIFESPPSN